LVVEDDFVVAMDVQDLLSELGFRDVYLAHDLRMGRALLLSKAPALGLLDVNIGRHPVFPLAAELRARRIPIIFSTGLAPTEFPSEWATHPIMPKPPNKRALIATLAGLGFVTRGLAANHSSLAIS